MSDFQKSRWTDKEFSQNYRDSANIYLPFRHQFIETVKSLYDHFISSKKQIKILDLGCGDGFFIQEFLKSFSPESITLVDGSNEMLEAAKKRLNTVGNINFIQASFQDLFHKDLLDNNFGFIYSSLAIHHLTLQEKKRLYSYIYSLLSPGGCFINYDAIISSSPKIESWYMSLWHQWINNHPNQEISRQLLNIPQKYKSNTDNIPDTLDSQIQALTQIGFKEVDCYFKHGIFCLFGGFK